MSVLRLASLVLPSRFLLAPLAGYTNLPFRLALRELGSVGLATTDLVNARALLHDSKRTVELIQTCPADRPLAVQLYGADAEEMAEAARWLEGQGAEVIDINMGCPVPKVCKGGGGSALLGEPDKAIALVRRMVQAVRCPVTVKMRLGVDDRGWVAPALAREFAQDGVAAIIIHGRTQAQGFRGSVSLDGIKAVVEAVVEAVPGVPVIGNGDIRTIADAARMLAATGCAGLAIGRGALLNPWLFGQLKRWEAGDDSAPPPTYEQRLDFMVRHFHLLIGQRGERFACLTFRKVANWYCRSLRPGRELKQALLRLDAQAVFFAVVDQLRQRGPIPCPTALSD